jgi:glycosyltransferase involved in cell wall biosynthesis
MRVLAFPRDDSNPYQRLLYDEMRGLGVRVDYLGGLTRSHSLNLLIMPLELAARRIGGARVVHLHWVHGFAIPGADRFPVLRRLAQASFAVWLATLRLLGIRLVWTMHNVLPHGQVFASDLRARRRLVSSCDLVLAHSPSALAELAELGAVPRRAAVVPHGPFAALASASQPRLPGAGNGPRRFLFFGRVLEYKGVDELIAAFAALPASAEAELTIAGECRDRKMRTALAVAAGQSGGGILLRLERVPDHDAADLFAAADAVVLPFRRVTTSGSAMLALCHGRPLVVPDLPALADLPDAAVIRYDRTLAGLTRAMCMVTDADTSTLAAMSDAALDYARTLAWPEIAVRTAREMAGVLASEPSTDSADSLIAAR